MRIVTGTISHETNTFSNIPTDLGEFAKESLTLGDEVLRRLAGTRTIEGAYLDAARQHGFELVPTVRAAAIPGGVVPRETLDWLLDRLLGGIRAAGPVDGVLLHLHGAMVAAGVDDAEGFILTAVRELVGPRVPVASTLDLHANVSEQMVRSADLLIGYDTYPHVDEYERGREVADRLVEILAGKLRPVAALAKPPLLPPLQSMVTTGETPMRELVELAHALEAEPGVVAVSVFGGFPFADIAVAGFSALAYADGDAALAQRQAARVARRAWEIRRRWPVHPTPVREAVARALAAPRGPVILADIADSGAGGTAGDGTAILQALLEAGARRVAVCSISDQEAIDACLAAGVGATLTLRVGGKRDRLHGDPVEVTGRVRLIHVGEFVREGPQGPGLLQRLGRTVLLEVGGSDGVDLLLTEHRSHPNDLGHFRAFGVEPTQRQALVLKSAAHFRAAFGPIASEIVEVDAPGITSPDLSRFAYTKVRRPIYPLDEGTTLTPGPLPDAGEGR